MPDTLNLVTLQSLEERLKAIIDDNVKDGGCACDTEVFDWISKMVVIRKGISLDIQQADLTGANVKIALFESLLDGGTNFDCGCN